MPEATPNYAVVSRETLDAVRAAFGTGDPAIPDTSPAPTIEDVHRFVTDRIVALLEDRRELLFSILYRIDVAEGQVMAVLAEAKPGEIPSRLADLVIRRQLRKVELRRQYGRADSAGNTWSRDEEA